MPTSIRSEGDEDQPGLVAAALRGDAAAFERLYRRHVRIIHGLLLVRVPRADVEDLMQDVFLTALRRLEQLRDPQAFAPWLAAIARNHARNHWRSARETETLDAELAGAPVVTHARAEAAEALAAIRALPEAYRETLLLRLVEGMTGPEIAAHTGLTPGSVRVNLHRGMKLLKQRLAGRGER